MDSQTYPIFQAIGSRKSLEGLALLFALLDGPATVEALAKDVGQSSSTASRRLDDLSLAGLVTRPSPRGAYELMCLEPTRRFLEAGHELATAILDVRQRGEAALDRQIKKSRLKARADPSETDRTAPA